MGSNNNKCKLGPKATCDTLNNVHLTVSMANSHLHMCVCVCVFELQSTLCPSARFHCAGGATFRNMFGNEPDELSHFSSTHNDSDDDAQKQQDQEEVDR